jgi:hypothetical protein
MKKILLIGGLVLAFAALMIGNAYATCGCTPPVGGIAVPVTVAADKSSSASLLGSYIALALAMVIMIATAIITICVICVKRGKEKQHT